jgi:hypothetical protein
MNIPDYFSESLETVFMIKHSKFFAADPGSEMEKFGSRKTIPDPQHHVQYSVGK